MKYKKYAKMIQSNSSDKCIHRYNVEVLNIFNKFKVQTVLVLQYKKRNDRKIFHSTDKLIASDSDIDEVLKSIHQSIMTKTKKCP